MARKRKCRIKENQRLLATTTWQNKSATAFGTIIAHVEGNCGESEYGEKNETHYV